MNNQQPNLDWKTIPEELCSCGCSYWRQETLLKNVPGLLLGTSKKTLVPLPVFVCANCGTAHKDFTGLKYENPPVLKN